MDEAEAAYQKALALDPQLADALTGLGNLKLQQGNIDDSIVDFEQDIALKQADGPVGSLGARFHLIQAHKVKPGDVNLAALEAMADEVVTWATTIASPGTTH